MLAFPSLSGPAPSGMPVWWGSSACSSSPAGAASSSCARCCGRCSVAASDPLPVGLQAGRTHLRPLTSNSESSSQLGEPAYILGSAEPVSVQPLAPIAPLGRGFASTWGGRAPLLPQAEETDAVRFPMKRGAQATCGIRAPSGVGGSSGAAGGKGVRLGGSPSSSNTFPVGGHRSAPASSGQPPCLAPGARWPPRAAGRDPPKQRDIVYAAQDFLNSWMKDLLIGVEAIEVHAHLKSFAQSQGTS